MGTRDRKYPVGRYGAVWAMIAAAANAAVYLIGRAANVAFVVPAFDGGDPMRIPLGQVIFVTLIMVLIGTGVGALANRFGRLSLVRWATLLVTLVSLGAPLSIDAEASTKVFLVTMHVVAGASFLVALRRAQRATELDLTAASASTGAAPGSRAA